MYTTNGTAQHAQVPILESRDAEEALLGCLVIDPDAIYDVGDILQAKDFYSVTNQWVYDALLSLKKRGVSIDPLTVIEELKARKQLEQCGGEAYIIGLAATPPTSTNARHYAQIIADKSTRRQMIAALQGGASKIYDESADVETQLSHIQSLVMGVGSERLTAQVSDTTTAVNRYLARLERLTNQESEISGLPTGFYDLDKMLNGLQKSQLYILGARPAMGKSAMAKDIVLSCITQGHKVLVWTGEMSSEQYIDRLVSTMTGIPHEQLNRPRELEKLSNTNQFNLIYEKLNVLKQQNALFIDETAGVSPMKLTTKAMRIHAKYGLDLIIVDHLHLMRPDKDRGNKTAEVGDNSQGLLELAKTLNVPVLCLCQLNRSCETRQDKRPILADLRESGEIEQNAYAVMFLYRDDYYNEMSEQPSTGEVLIRKNRDGKTGDVMLYWDSNVVAFKNLQRQEVAL